LKELITKLQNINSLELLEELRVEVLGKKGLLAKEFARLKDIPNKDKKEFAQNINSFKVEFNSAFEDKKTTLLSIEIDKKLKEEKIDVSLFNSLDNSAAFHPVLETMDRIIDYFIALNFSLQEGPLVEDDFHNFEALNLPKFHPARDMQDTFYFKDQMMLRTHTSPVQIRTMLQTKPPIRAKIEPINITKGTAIVPNKAPTINISFISPPPSPSIPLRNLYALLIQKKNPDPRIAPAIELRVETPIIGAAKNANILPGMVRISGRIKILRSIKLKTIKIPPKIKNIKEVKEMPNFKTIRRDHTPEISSTMKYLMEILDLHFVHFPFNNM
jgi:hypothetical protein